MPDGKSALICGVGGQLTVIYGVIQGAVGGRAKSIRGILLGSRTTESLLERGTVLQGNIRTVDGNQAHARIGGCVRVLRTDLCGSIRKFSHILGIQVGPRLGKRLPAHRIFLEKIIVSINSKLQ